MDGDNLIDYHMQNLTEVQADTFWPDPFLADQGQAMPSLQALSGQPGRPKRLGPMLISVHKQ